MLFVVSLDIFGIVLLCLLLVSILHLHINPNGHGDVLRDMGGEGITIAPSTGVEEKVGGEELSYVYLD